MTSITLLQVKFKDLLKLNAPDWPLVTVGILASALVGATYPSVSLFFSEMLKVHASGPNEFNSIV